MFCAAGIGNERYPATLPTRVGNLVLWVVGCTSETSPTDSGGHGSNARITAHKKDTHPKGPIPSAGW